MNSFSGGCNAEDGMDAEDHRLIHPPGRSHLHPPPVDVRVLLSLSAVEDEDEFVVAEGCGVGKTEREGLHFVPGVNGRPAALSLARLRGKVSAVEDALGRRGERSRAV